MEHIEKIFEFIGAVGTLSFIFIAFSDLVVHSITIVITKLVALKDTPTSKKIVYLWEVMADLYEEFRLFLDRLSAYSRPRIEDKGKKGKK